MVTSMRFLVTGAAGFIGFHLSQNLLERGDTVIGLDNLNSYYDVSLKEARLSKLSGHKNFCFFKLNLEDRQQIADLFIRERPQRVVHLAAQAGVRHSLKDPHAYVDSNIVGFSNILEGCCHTGVEHLVYASSSSVYSANTKIPFSVHDNVDHPISLYAATKKANELMAHSYSHLYGLPTTGLRLFTVYGPWGRPDMAVFLFTKAILAGKPVRLFNFGRMERDFTYIDDVVEGITHVSDCIPKPNLAWNSDCPDPASSRAPYRLYNLGNHSPVDIITLINILERCLDRKARRELLPMQQGEMLLTYANIDDLVTDVGFKPSTSLDTGIEHFVKWYLEFYSL